MAQGQTKPKVETRQRGRNNNRANGKAWKKKWGTNPPIEQSAADHNRGQERRTKQKAVKPKRRRK